MLLLVCSCQTRKQGDAMARYSPDQLQYVNSPKLKTEVAKWIITATKPSPAQKGILDYAGLAQNPNPHNQMIEYVYGLLETRYLHDLVMQVFDEHRVQAR